LLLWMKNAVSDCSLLNVGRRVWRQAGVPNAHAFGFCARWGGGCLTVYQEGRVELPLRSQCTHGLHPCNASSSLSPSTRFWLVNSTVECWSEKPVDTVQFRDEPPDFGEWPSLVEGACLGRTRSGVRISPPRPELKARLS